MKVSDLIALLSQYPQDALLGKVSISDDTGLNDSKMTAQDWDIVKATDDDGIEAGGVIVFCSFGGVASSKSPVK